eukprot:3834716-Amphidinium_carterae.1
MCIRDRTKTVLQIAHWHYAAVQWRRREVMAAHYFAHTPQCHCVGSSPHVPAPCAWLELKPGAQR